MKSANNKMFGDDSEDFYINMQKEPVRKIDKIKDWLRRKKQPKEVIINIKSLLPNGVSIEKPGISEKLKQQLEKVLFELNNVETK
jgi:hypothetical protein